MTETTVYTLKGYTFKYRHCLISEIYKTPEAQKSKKKAWFLWENENDIWKYLGEFTTKKDMMEFLDWKTGKKQKEHS